MKIPDWWSFWLTAACSCFVLSWVSGELEQLGMSALFWLAGVMYFIVHLGVRVGGVIKNKGEKR